MNKYDPWGLKGCETNQIKEDIEKLKKDIEDIKKLLEAIKEYLKNKSISFPIPAGVYQVRGYTIVVKGLGTIGEITLNEQLAPESFNAENFTVKDAYGPFDADVETLHVNLETGEWNATGSVWGLGPINVSGQINDE